MYQGSTEALFARYAVPQMIGLLLNSVYIIVDGIFIGNRLGTDAMAAAAVSVPLVEILIALSIAISSGAGVLISGHIGRSEYPDAVRIFNTITSDLTTVMKTIDLPYKGTDYKASIELLQDLPICRELQNRAYGGMPIELGMCWGWNTRLNCLEYHRDSEINIGSHDFILLLAKVDEIENGTLDTAKIKAFRVPANIVIEVYATTLHYAPCHVEKAEGFRVAVALPYGTNFDYRLSKVKNWEDRLLLAKNKWLLAHLESQEAKNGAYVGLTGRNIDLEAMA